MTMNVIAAAEETLEAARRGFEAVRNPTLIHGTQISHFEDMVNRMRAMSPHGGKINRWLGWMQGAATANGWLSLEECKAINKRHADQ